MAIIILIAFFSALGMVQIDQALRLTPDPDRIWLYGGGADSATAVLSAVTSSAITVAGIIFSATYVTMQLASSQYTPRVVQALSRRWNLQVVLGIFLANFVYSLVVLRSVRPSTTARPEEFVPVLAVSVCVALSIACVGVLVYYITYGMHSLQPTFLINSAASETERLLERSRLASSKMQQGASIEGPIAVPDDARILTAATSGFIQRVRFEELLAIVREADVAVSLDGNIGHFYLAGEPVMSVWPPEGCTPEIEQKVRATLSIGDERTPEQDIEFGFRRVADIMLKAISPAINDPTTAEYCINTLGNLVLLLATEDEPRRYLADDDGTVRLLWKAEPFNRCVRTAFGQLRFYAVRDASLVCYVLNAFERVTLLVPEGRRPVLIEQAGVLRDAALAATPSAADRALINHGSAWIATYA